MRERTIVIEDRPEATENQRESEADSSSGAARCRYGRVAVRNRDLFDQSFWEDLTGNSPELVDNPEGAEHLAYRFVGQYLPALLRARTKEESDHVWLAFWSYLIARRSRRKPFGLSQQAADRLITEFQISIRCIACAQRSPLGKGSLGDCRR